MHLVAEREELLGQMGHVFGNAAGVRKVIGRDEGELHGLPLLTRAALPASASGIQSIAPDGRRYGTAAFSPQPESAPVRPVVRCLSSAAPRASPRSTRRIGRLA